MIVWLDFRIFGHGRGMAMPHFDGRLYWLAGEFYTFSPGFGAQLTSYQWRHPRAGEERWLCGRTFRVLHSSRRWGRVQVAWGMVGLAGLSIDEQHRRVRHLGSIVGDDMRYRDQP